MARPRGLGADPSTAPPETPPPMIVTPAEAQAILRKTIPERLPILLAGAPGVGKTAIVSQVAHELARELVVSHPVTSDPTDFRGLPWMVDGKATFLPIGDLARLIALGDRPAVWLIDDLGQALTSTQAAVMQLVHRDSRALNGFSLPDNVAIVACTNRAEDRAGVGAFLAPLVSRFTTVLTVCPEAKSFVPWAIQHGGFHPVVAAFLRWKEDYLLDTSRPSHSLEQRCSPRTWDNVSRLLKLGLRSSELAAPIQGAITPSIATEFLAFLQVFENLPDIDLVRADPDGAPLPPSVDATYATAVHLARKVERADFDLIARYVARLAPEFQLLFNLSSITRKPELRSTTAYIAWASRPEITSMLS
ncbi:MAG TPA: ATP-binding protein [Methylomirabilota bacterium]